MEAIRSLGGMPERCPVALVTRSLQAEVRSLLVGTHRVFFVVRESFVEVLHVRHTRRKPLIGGLPDASFTDEEESR
jgi:plasmid stabilization system protein ParE